jgi:hypothetical protein
MHPIWNLSQAFAVGVSLEQTILFREAFANDLEECAHASGSFQIGVGHDPQFPSQLGHRVRQCSRQAGIAVAEIAGEKRQAPPVPRPSD